MKIKLILIKKRGLFKLKTVVGIVCVVPLLMQLGGCAAKKVYKKPAVQTHKKIALNPKDIVEIQYIRTNVYNLKFEKLTLTQEEARFEYPARDMMVTRAFSKEELLALAKKAVSFSWKLNPVRVRNRQLKEELILKTLESQEKVEFEETLSGGLREFYGELFMIRQTMFESGE